MAGFDADALLSRLPAVRGRLTPMAALSGLTWLRVGGPAEVLFSPADEADLAAFLATAPEDVPVTPIGVGSNLIVRDGGVPGVVVRLGKGFGAIDIDIDAGAGAARVTAGAAALDGRVAEAAAAAGVGGLEFLRGVPGAIGGAVRMNAGCYGAYVADVFVSARAVSRRGDVTTLGPGDMAFSYRDSGPRGLIYTQAALQGRLEPADDVKARMDALMDRRAASQPVRDRTAGSTFKNPAGYSSTGAQGDPMAMKAWSLIDRAGCRGLRRGGAVMSEKHSNFLTNAGGATAADLEGLGEEVRRRVFDATGVTLEWEVQRIGTPLDDL